MAQSNFTFIDLFAGVGGFHFAMKAVGGKCVFASEIEKNAQKTYFANHGIQPHGDITLDEVRNAIPEQFDILCGGFPCQAFSIAGLQKGFSDSRGTLFFEIEKIVAKHRPKVVFLENVRNLVSHDKGKTFQVILDILENKLNYTVFYKIMNSCDYSNIPQNRERIFIVAFNNEVYDKDDNLKFNFPEKIPLTRKISDIIDYSKQDDIFYYTEKYPHYDLLVQSIVDKNRIYQRRRGAVIRDNRKGLCPTLTASMGTGGHNVPIILDDYGIRKLTPKECFAFQGYDMDTFIFPDIANSKLYIQAGNSVTMPVVKRIAEQIIKVL